MSATTPMDPRVSDKMMPFMVSRHNNEAVVIEFDASLVHMIILCYLIFIFSLHLNILSCRDNQYNAINSICIDWILR